MRRGVIELALICFFYPGQGALYAQEFRLFDRQVQIHGFASQGFVYRNNNNWLTMKSSAGSAAFTDFGANVSMQVTDRLRIGAQVYDHNIGNLGEWHPLLDWAFADYRFKPWLSFRGGKVKTVIGLDNDTQDYEFLGTFALLPQAVYPIDMHDANIAHTGGDLYGDVPLGRRAGSLSYTVYGGARYDSHYSGYPYALRKTAAPVDLTSNGGPQYGSDLRWHAPLPELLVGISRLNEHDNATGTFVPFWNPAAGTIPYWGYTRHYWLNQYYGTYSKGRLRLASAYRRTYIDAVVLSGTSNAQADVRGWYVLGSYRVAKWLELGSYYSRYTMTAHYGGILGMVFPPLLDTSLPENHIYDKVVAGRIDLNQCWNVKLEGHFMDGYGDGPFPNGFYPGDNPAGFKRNTNALVVRTGFNF
jgi:hypothetical protein